MQQDRIDALRHLALPRQALLIGGQWKPAADGRTLDVTSPIDGTTLCTLADAGATDVDRAVARGRDVVDVRGLPTKRQWDAQLMDFKLLVSKLDG